MISNSTTLFNSLITDDKILLRSSSNTLCRTEHLCQGISDCKIDRLSLFYFFTDAKKEEVTPSSWVTQQMAVTATVSCVNIFFFPFGLDSLTQKSYLRVHPACVPCRL